MHLIASKHQVVILGGIMVSAVSSLAGQQTSSLPVGATTSAVRVTAEHYARAEKLIAANIGRYVRNLLVIPHWVGNTDSFWYKQELEGGHVFVLVNADTGEKRPAFDHAALASAVSDVTGEDYSAKDLPFEAFTFQPDRNSISFVLGSREYTCPLALSSCSSEPLPDPNWLIAPDGEKAVFTRDNNLWLRDLNSGRERPLTRDGEVNFGYGIYYDNWKASFVARRRGQVPQPPMETFWSPDSRTVIVGKLDQRHVAPYPLIETVPADGSLRPILHPMRLPLIGEKAVTIEWHAIDVTSSSMRRLELPYEKLLHVHQDMTAIRDYWWSEDNGHLFVVAFGDYLEGVYLFDINLQTGQVRTVLEEHTTPRTDLNSTSYNPPNVHVVGDGDEVIWFSQRSGWGHLYLYDGNTGELKNPITHGDWLVRDLIEVDKENRRIFFTVGGREGGNPYYRHLYRVNFDGSDLTLLTPEPHDHLFGVRKSDILLIDGTQGYDVVSPSGNYVVYNVSPIDQPTESVIRKVDGARLVSTFQRGNADALFAMGVRGPEEFVVKAADGTTDLHGVLYKPSDFDPSIQYPIIDAQYASPLTAVTPRNFYHAMTAMLLPADPAAVAELGFVVMVIDARGTTFRSREFSHYSYNRLHTMGLEDHVAAIRQLGERFDYIDTERVGIYGHSYGGHTTLRAMLEYPEFFKVGISDAGVGLPHGLYPDYHWHSFHRMPIYPDGSNSRPSPSADPVNWDELDVRKQAHRLQGKLMLSMAELDENVPSGVVTQLIDALINADKDFDLVYMPNANHYFTGHPYVIRRHWDFLVRHLLEVEPPQYSLGQQ